jgi:hypothetical protein
MKIIGHLRSEIDLDNTKHILIEVYDEASKQKIYNVAAACNTPIFIGVDKVNQSCNIKVLFKRIALSSKMLDTPNWLNQIYKIELRVTKYKLKNGNKWIVGANFVLVKMEIV